jgi:hypothetical protein
MMQMERDGWVWVRGRKMKERQRAEPLVVVVKVGGNAGVCSH